MVDFARYLASLVTAYEQWWKLYALTDAAGLIKEQEQEQALPSPFDFGLMEIGRASCRERVFPVV